MNTDGNILEVNDLHVYIGGYYIIQGISFSVPADGVTVLLGRNGAGKTTTLKSLICLAPPRRGSVTFNREEITHLPPYKIAEKGVNYIPDTFRLFSNLTVEENLKIAMIKRGKKDGIEEVLNAFPDLRKFFREKAKNLSGGQQHMLAIARAMCSNSRLLLVDEPTEGLSPMFRDKVIEVLKRASSECPILLAEGNLRIASALGERYYILSNGRIVMEGDMERLLFEKDAIEKHMGIKV